MAHDPHLPSFSKHLEDRKIGCFEIQPEIQGFNVHRIFVRDPLSVTDGLTLGFGLF
jgi:hypothetical protein